LYGGKKDFPDEVGVASPLGMQEALVGNEPEVSIWGIECGKKGSELSLHKGEEGSSGNFDTP